MAVPGLIPGTQDYGITENKFVQSLFPWLSQVNNPAVQQTAMAQTPSQGAIRRQGTVSGGGGSWGGTSAPLSAAQAPSGGGTSKLDQLRAMEREGSLNPAQRTELNQLLEQNPQQPTIDYDALIRPALEALDQAVGPQESAYAANVADIEAGANKSTGSLQASQQETEASATRRKGQLGQESESAIDEARRQFAEIQQGLQARYGKTTGTGAFAETYLGGQTMRNIGQQRTALTNAISTIDDRLEQVKTVTDIGLKDIAEQANAQKLKAKAELDQNLNQIRIAKGELLSRKAELAQQAMQVYQQQVAEINARNTAFQQQLYRDQIAAENQLALAREKASKAVDDIRFTAIGPDKYGFVNETKQTVQPFTPTAGGSLNPNQYEEDDFIDL